MVVGAATRQGQFAHVRLPKFNVAPLRVNGFSVEELRTYLTYMYTVKDFFTPVTQVTGQRHQRRGCLLFMDARIHFRAGVPLSPVLLLFARRPVCAEPSFMDGMHPFTDGIHPFMDGTHSLMDGTHPLWRLTCFFVCGRLAGVARLFDLHHGGAPPRCRKGDGQHRFRHRFSVLLGFSL